MRRADDHVHPEYWTENAHHRYEDRTSSELLKIDKRLEMIDHRVEGLTTRITLLIGGLGLIAFLLPIISPFVRLWLGLDVPSGQ